MLTTRSPGLRREKGVPGIPCLVCKLKTCNLILNGHQPLAPTPPHHHHHLTQQIHTWGTPLQSYTISICHAPQSYSEGKQLFPTDRQLNQITCLGNRLDLFWLTERPTEFLKTFVLQNSVRKRITWIQLTCNEVIMLKVGFRVPYITGLYTHVWC